jgi:hypothetical protein
LAVCAWKLSKTSFGSPPGFAGVLTINGGTALMMMAAFCGAFCQSATFT